MLGKAVFRDFCRIFRCALFAPVVSLLCVFDADAATAPAFSVTTTSLSTGNTFQFTISASGTFSVDCGSGGTLSGTGVTGATTIDRSTTTTNDTYTCSYSSGGVKTISFYDGYSANGYNTDSTVAAISFKNNTYVKELDGDLSAVFPEVGGQYPSFYETFSGCTNLITIPSTLFAHITFGKTNEFRKTFSGCTGLTSLPNGLFSNVSSSNNSNRLFEGTFYGCTGLTNIPGNLFAGITTGADSMFWGTFEGCSGLISLPNGLFANVVNTANTMYLFENTFKNCTGLTNIPGDLFAGITTGATSMFNATFYGCTHLTAIPPNLFSNITTSAPSLFAYTFSGCSTLTSIPNNLFAGITTGAADMFYTTFLNCTGLQSLPSGLFANITTAAPRMFVETFKNCTGLTGTFIPPTLFDGLINNGSPTASNMMKTVFFHSDLLSACPEDYYQFITGYESDWDGKVSCKPCPTGKVSPAGSTNINQCVRRDYVFSLNTTQLNANDTFKFLIASAGTFFIDCGTDGILTSADNDVTARTDGGYRVIRTHTNGTTYTCTYSTGGSKTIQFGGEATEYSNFAAIRFNINVTDANEKKIASISGSLGQIFGTIANLSTSSGQPKFLQTFYDATNMTGTIPPTLFDGVSGVPAINMFNSTFSGCSGLTGVIPSGLFGNLSGAPAINMFNSTFSGCSGLTGFGDKTYVPGDFLENIDTNTSVSNQAINMFSGTQLDNPCPAGTYSVTRAQFNDAGKPWCAECPPGTSSLAGATDVSQCDQTITPTNPTTYTVTYHSGNCHPEHQTDYTNTTHSVPDSVHPATGDTYTVNMDVHGILLSPLFVEFNNMNFPTGDYDTCATFLYWEDDYGNTYSYSTNVSNPVIPTIAPYGSSDTNLYARCYWYPIEVGFYPGTCSGNVLREEKGTYGTSFSMPSVANTNISVPANYHFSGWSNNSNATSVDYEVDDTYTIDVCVYTNDKNDEPYIKFYAVCSPDTYNINYHNVLNSDTWTGNHPNTYTYGAGASVGVPSRTGYTFLGWCVNNSTCSNYATNISSYTISTTDTGDVDLYAMWDCDTNYQWVNGECVPTTYHIYYHNTENATWGTGQNHPNTYTYGVGAYIGVPSRTGYTFLGWCVNNSTCSNYANYMNGYTISASSAADINLYAMWEQNSSNIVNLTWIVNGQEYNSNPSSCEYGTGTIGSIQHQEIPGWTFTGWKVTNWWDETNGLKGVDVSKNGINCYAKPVNNNASYCYDYNALQNTISNGSDYDYSCGNKGEEFDDLGNNEWKVLFDYGTVYGHAKCINSDTNNESAEGKYCWCQITGFKPSGEPNQHILNSMSWFYDDDLSLVNRCWQNCAYNCGLNIFRNQSYRINAFDQTQ